MARFYGPVGYAETSETSPGVWEEQITERLYSGDILSISRRHQSSEHLNDNILVSNEISIVADPYAFKNFFNIKYVKWNGTRWKVSNVKVDTPRLTLSLGDIYTGIGPQEEENGN